MYQNYPNPFNPSTSIKFSVQEKTRVKLSVLDVLGSEITVLVDEVKNPGDYEVTFSTIHHPQSLPSGIYFYKLVTDSCMEVKKMILMK